MIGLLSTSIVGWQLLDDTQSQVYNFHFTHWGWDITAEILQHFLMNFLESANKKGP